MVFFHKVAMWGYVVYSPLLDGGGYPLSYNWFKILYSNTPLKTSTSSEWVLL